MNSLDVMHRHFWTYCQQAIGIFLKKQKIFLIFGKPISWRIYPSQIPDFIVQFAMLFAQLTEFRFWGYPRSRETWFISSLTWHSFTSVPWFFVGNPEFQRAACSEYLEWPENKQSTILWKKYDPSLNNILWFASLFFFWNMMWN